MQSSFINKKQHNSTTPEDNPEILSNLTLVNVLGSFGPWDLSRSQTVVENKNNKTLQKKKRR
jgi:hypothetical protein